MQIGAVFLSIALVLLALDKIFTTGSSTAFVHVRCNNQHEMKVPQKDFKSFYITGIIQRYIGLCDANGPLQHVLSITLNLKCITDTESSSFLYKEDKQWICVTAAK